MALTKETPPASLSSTVLASLPPKAKTLWDAHVANFPTNDTSRYPQPLASSRADGRLYEELRLPADSETFRTWKADDWASKNLFMNDPFREDLRTLKYTVEKIPSKPVDGTGHVYPLYIVMHGGGEDKNGTEIDGA